MSKAWEFESAVKFLKRWAGQDTQTAGVGDDYFAAEEFILDHKPRCAGQAATLIDVITDNVRVGSRIDGRYISALANLKHWVLATTDFPEQLTK